MGTLNDAFHVVRPDSSFMWSDVKRGLVKWDLKSLGNGVPNFGQFPLQKSASNPPLARAAISRNFQISEGSIRT